MYEGPIKAADFAGSEESPILRQLRWTDLVARIAATRGMRVPPADYEEPDASFAAFHRELSQDSQQGINRDDLSHGKSDRLDTSGAAKIAGDGDRETR